MKLHRFGPAVAIAMAASLVLTACGDDNPAAGNETTPDSNADTDAAAGSEGADTPASGGDLSGTLAGAGASSQDSAMAAWVAGYNADVEPGVTVNYDGVGSGAGREQFIAGAVQFAGSDAALDDEERAAVTTVCGDGGAMNLPVYISPVAIPFNLDGVTELNLTPTVLAQIFDQQITTWNDEAIAADNPDVALPDQSITVVNRSDDSGTTENFMEYLSAAAPDAWSYEADKAWPISGGEAAAQTSGVIQVVGATPGSIGYSDASAVGQLSTAKVGVGEEFVAFSPEAAAKVVDASEAIDTGIEGDLALELARDTTESGAYPIVLVSYHLVCKEYADAGQADLVKSFLGYVISEEGQAASADAAGSAPISADLRAKAEESLASINAGR